MGNAMIQAEYWYGGSLNAGGTGVASFTFLYWNLVEPIADIDNDLANLNFTSRCPWNW